MLSRLLIKFTIGLLIMLTALKSIINVNTAKVSLNFKRDLKTSVAI